MKRSKCWQMDLLSRADFTFSPRLSFFTKCPILPWPALLFHTSMKLLLSLVAPVFIAALLARIQASNNQSSNFEKFTINQKSETDVSNNEKDDIDDMDENSSDGILIITAIMQPTNLFLEKMSSSNDYKYNYVYNPGTYFENEDLDSTPLLNLTLILYFRK